MFKTLYFTLIANFWVKSDSGSSDINVGKSGLTKMYTNDHWRQKCHCIAKSLTYDVKVTEMSKDGIYILSQLSDLRKLIW